jgi:hypothetical protein
MTEQQRPAKRRRMAKAEVEVDPQFECPLVSMMPMEMLREIANHLRTDKSSYTQRAESHLAFFCLRRTCRYLYRAIGPAPKGEKKTRRRIGMGELAVQALCLPMMREAVAMGLPMRCSRSNAIDAAMSSCRFDVAWQISNMMPWYQQPNTIHGDLPRPHLHDRCIMRFAYQWDIFLETLIVHAKWAAVKQMLLASSAGICLYAYDVIHCLLVLDAKAMTERATIFCKWMAQCAESSPQRVFSAIYAAAAWLKMHATSFLQLPCIIDFVATYTTRQCGRPACDKPITIECHDCGAREEGGYCSNECRLTDQPRHARTGHCSPFELQRMIGHDASAAYYAPEKIRTVLGQQRIDACKQTLTMLHDTLQKVRHAN